MLEGSAASYAMIGLMILFCAFEIVSQVRIAGPYELNYARADIKVGMLSWSFSRSGTFAVG